MLVAAVLLFALAAICYIVGDPVRGPFTYLIHPRAKDTFTFHAGIASVFPFKRLGDGLDFSDVIKFGNPNGKKPVLLWVQRTWPLAWQFRVSIFAAENEPPIVFIDEKEIKHQSPLVDVNYDDTCLEVIEKSDKIPVFQLILADNDDIYVNCVLRNRTTALIMNGDAFRMLPIESVTVKDFPDRLFKYPAYSHKGQRE